MAEDQKRRGTRTMISGRDKFTGNGGLKSAFEVGVREWKGRGEKTEIRTRFPENLSELKSFARCREPEGDVEQGNVRSRWLPLIIYIIYRLETDVNSYFFYRR